MNKKRVKGEGPVMANQMRSGTNKLNPEEQFT